jgi:hypothetical protein
LLRRHRPILYFECQALSLARQGETPEAVWSELDRAGYRTFARQDDGFVVVTGLRPGVVNYLGIPDLPTTVGERFDHAALVAAVETWSARPAGA